MSHMIAAAVEQASGRGTLLMHYARTVGTGVWAMIAVVAGLSTLNMAVAESGLLTLNEMFEPVLQFVGIGRQG